MAELYLMFKAIDMYWIGLFLDFNLRLKDFVDTFHRRQSLRNIVACLGEVFQRVDDAVEHDEIIDERRSVEQ